VLRLALSYPDRPNTGNDRYFDGDDVVLERWDLKSPTEVY
jgi:hypothetical protein